MLRRLGVSFRARAGLGGPNISAIHRSVPSTPSATPEGVNQGSRQGSAGRREFKKAPEASTLRSRRSRACAPAIEGSDVGLTLFSFPFQDAASTY